MNCLGPSIFWICISLALVGSVYFVNSYKFLTHGRVRSLRELVNFYPMVGSVLFQDSYKSLTHGGVRSLCELVNFLTHGGVRPLRELV